MARLLKSRTEMFRVTFKKSIQIKGSNTPCAPMMLQAKKEVGDQAPFELKGSLFTLTVMHLYQTDQSIIGRYLDQKIKQAPIFFHNAPVIIDLKALVTSPAPVDFANLYDLLRRHGMIPVAVRNGTDEMHAEAALAGLPVMPEGRSAGMANKHDKPEVPPVRHSRIIRQPVRSGQQVYAPGGDLILLGVVSPGAEVLADGNIHIYAPLRGRALAGVKGDTEARIFCQSLEAELVSVAGYYRVSEQLSATDRGKAVQIYLLEDHLMVAPLLK